MMNIFVSGINYRNTPLEIREKLAFSEHEVKELLAAICSLHGVSGAVMLSTCNRTEIYIDGSDAIDISLVESAVCSHKSMDYPAMKKHFYGFESKGAVRHIFKVASGLDSMIFGEDQILGQVKSAHKLSHEMGLATAVLNTLFKRAITAAKDVKTNTDLSRCPISVETIALKAIESEFTTDLEGLTAFVIGGSGKIGSSILKSIAGKNVKKVYASIRSHCGENRLVSIKGGIEAVPYDDRYKYMDRCDIVISATSSPHYTLTGDMLKNHITTDKKRVFIDLAVPRDIDSDVVRIFGAKYFNIDYLSTISDENMVRRLEAGERAKIMLEEHISSFYKWHIFRKGASHITDLERRYREALKKNIMTDDELDAVDRISSELIRKVSYDIRDVSTPDELESFFNCVKKILKGGEKNG
jgi:glutamyl-tRNA reductase